MDKDIRTTIREVQRELDELWLPARSLGANGPPPSRVTFSRIGWLDFLSDPEIRQCYSATIPPEIAMETVLGARIVIDRHQRERFKVELTGDSDV